MQGLVDCDWSLLQLKLGRLVVVVDHRVAVLYVPVGASVHYLLALPVFEVNLKKTKSEDYLLLTTLVFLLSELIGETIKV